MNTSCILMPATSGLTWWQTSTKSPVENSRRAVHILEPISNAVPHRNASCVAASARSAPTAPTSSSESICV